MRMRFALLFVAGALLGAPSASQAQGPLPQFGGEVPPVLITGPLSHPRYEEGGFFCFFQGLYWRETRPLRNQTIAVRGFFDLDGSVTGSPPGTFVGSGEEALNVGMLRGSGTWQPGFNIGVGWRFENGVVVQANWYHLTDAKYAVSAGLLNSTFQPGANLENTFLTGKVFNFPIDYSGPTFDVAVGNGGATFGIWNAASNMTIEFLQRFDQFDITGRIPIWQTDNFRTYGLVGPRVVTMWERFKWRTVDPDVNGNAVANDVAIYFNTVSNRLYGAACGCGGEWFLGDTRIGGFSCSVDGLASLYGDFAKGRVKYELGDLSTAASRARNFATIAPGLEGRINLLWYPWEAVQFQLGYSGMMFFNTISSPHPVDFNFGTIDPQFSSGTFRLFHGFTFGVSFVF
ncbi:MAG: hypothetical protein HY040_04235 [Planctomycetes bacterium]|nr:hypothetical protein [Planctomycetota bacterium]